MLIMVTMVENVINIKTATLARLTFSRVRRSDTQLMRIPMGIVKVVPCGIGIKNRKIPKTDARINLAIFEFLTGFSSTVVTASAAAAFVFSFLSKLLS